MYKEDIEIRKLPAGALAEIINILETNDGWKKIMCKIPKDPLSEQFVPKYNDEHIRKIEEHAKETGLKCTEILFDEWGTSGRIRPTLSTLKDILYKTKDELYRAAVQIALLLNEPLPQRPNQGPAAPITIDITTLLNTATKTQDTSGSTHEQSFNNRICNQTTAKVGCENNETQISDMIKCSSEINRPNLSVLQNELHKAATHVMEESSDNSSSVSNMPNITILQHPTKPRDTSNNISNEISVNIPNVVASMNSLLKDNTADIKLTMPQSDAQSSSYSSESMGYSHSFQTSLPNIDFKSNAIHDIMLQQTNLIKFSYKDLINITGNFSTEIGSGGFAEVFKGSHPQYGALAVKKQSDNSYIRHDKMIKAFISEIINLSQFNHKNIVPILGFSTDGPALCIVCEYVDGGSLHNKIQQKVLTEKQRIDIMVGTAEGLRYLHSNTVKNADMENNLGGRNDLVTTSNVSKKGNFIHGDVKSVNILLTKDCVPKLCDFGLARQIDVTHLTKTRTLLGSSGYMAPESYGGTISQKSDIYSYGIVLLELLTGLEPLIKVNNEIVSLKEFIEESDADINQFLDPVIDKWAKANEIYEIAQMCLARVRQDRPSIDQICDMYKTKLN